MSASAKKAEYRLDRSPKDFESMRLQKQLIMLLLSSKTYSDLIGINKYQNTIQHHNIVIKQILIGKSRAALENALLKRYFSFVEGSTTGTLSNGSKIDGKISTATKLTKLENVKRNFRRHRYFKYMQS